MENIYILGSGGFAKEVYTLIKHIGKYDFQGFVDIGAKPPITIGKDTFPVFSEDHLEGLQGENMLAIGVGDPALIVKLSQKFKEKFSFPNLVHPTVVGNFDDIGFGVGNIITANCVFTTSIKVGSFNIFNLSCTIGHDSIIGDCNVINPAVNISGGVEIGNTNLIGVNATILQYKKIGNNSIVGAASLVTKDVTDNILVIGVPAVKLKSL